MIRFARSYRGHCDHLSVPQTPALETTDLRVSYGGKLSEHALAGVSVRVERGSRTALIGPNGAGKSTLLKAVVGLLKPCGGSLRVFGHEVGRCVHQVAYLPQRSSLDWAFPVTVERLVMAGRYVHCGWLRGLTKDDRRLVAEALEKLGLSGLARRRISDLSGGQQQRALLARTLVHGAQLILLDEPLNAIDRTTRSYIDRVVDDLQREGKTVLMATHDVDRKEHGFDAVIAFEDGHQVALPTEGTGHA